MESKNVLFNIRSLFTYFDIIPTDIIIIIWYILLDQNLDGSYVNFYGIYSQFDVLSSDDTMKRYLQKTYPQ